MSVLSYPRQWGVTLLLKIHADVFSKNELGIEMAVAVAVAVVAVAVAAAAVVAAVVAGT